MSCILNIDHFTLPNDIVVLLTKIYKYIGKNDYYEDVIGSNKNRVVDQTVEKDSYFLSKILKLNLTEARTKLIINKDSVPRNKDVNIGSKIAIKLGKAKNTSPIRLWSQFTQLIGL